MVTGYEKGCTSTEEQARRRKSGIRLPKTGKSGVDAAKCKRLDWRFAFCSSSSETFNSNNEKTSTKRTVNTDVVDCLFFAFSCNWSSKRLESTAEVSKTSFSTLCNVQINLQRFGVSQLWFEFNQYIYVYMPEYVLILSMVQPLTSCNARMISSLKHAAGSKISEVRGANPR